MDKYAEPYVAQICKSLEGCKRTIAMIEGGTSVPGSKRASESISKSVIKAFCSSGRPPLTEMVQHNDLPELRLFLHLKRPSKRKDGGGRSLEDPSPAVRRVAATTLGELGEFAESSLPGLIDMLLGSTCAGRGLQCCTRHWKGSLPGFPLGLGVCGA